jgi:hypothetical protein
MSAAARLGLVDPAELALSIVAQCQLLKVARSTLYYRPVPVSAEELALMRRMDELHLAASALTGADPLSLNKADPADARLPVGGCGGGICGTGSR